METLTATKPRTSHRVSDIQNSHKTHGQYIAVNGVVEKAYTVDEVFSRLEKNLNDFYGTNYKLE
ncbi:MAG: hypothetical protein FWC39_07230 [Bacteroidetes bacterium]|nr:hypothetical protein [Bacteroidota bacterium]